MFKRFKSPEVNSLSLAVITLLLFIPLYPKFPLFNVAGTYVAIRFEDLLIAFFVFIWFIIQAKQKFPAFKDKLGKLILLYWGVGLLSLLSAVLITRNIVPHIATLHYLRRVEYMSLFFIGIASFRKLEQVKTYIWLLLLSTVGVTIYGLGQKFYSWPVISTMNEEFSKGMLLRLSEWARINSTFAGHYDLAAYMVIILAIVIAFAFALKNKWAKLLTVLIGISSYYILILTASRVSFVAYLIAAAFVLILLKKYWWVGPILVLSITGMLLSSEISQRYALTFDIDLAAISARLPKREVKPVGLVPTLTPTPIPEEKDPKTGGRVVKSIPTPTPTLEPEATASAEIEEWRPTTELAVEYSSGIRFNVEWPRSLRAFAKNPILGTGYSSVTLATDNDYLRLLAETGLLGFITFFMIFFEILRRVVVFLRSNTKGFARNLVIGLSGAAIGLLGNAVFIDVFESSKIAFIFWLLMGILVGIMQISQNKTEKA